MWTSTLPPKPNKQCKQWAPNHFVPIMLSISTSSVSNYERREINLKFKISRGNKSTPKPARSPKQCHWHRKNIQPLAIIRNYIQKQEKRDALHFKITFSLVQHYNTGMEKPLVLQIIDSSEFKLKTGIFYWTKSGEWWRESNHERDLTWVR